MPASLPTGPPLETFSAATRARFGDDAAGWLSGIEGLVSELGSRWSLELGTATASVDAYLVDVERSGEPLALEVSYPDGWWAETTAALQAWLGGATPRLFEHDARGARLLERAEPIPAGTDEAASLKDVCALAPRLWIPAPDGITTVAVEARAWAAEIQERHVRAGRPFERELVRSAMETLSTLAPTQGERVLLHGDLHLTSLALADERRVLTDPRPLVGEREFDVASLVRDTPMSLLNDVNEGRRRVKERFDLLVEELGCNPNRLKGWAVATGVDQGIWCAENGDHGTGTALVETARMIRAIEL